MPEEYAKQYEIGHEVTTADNHVYVVKMVKRGEKEFKRWILKK